MIGEARFVIDETSFSAVTFGPQFGEWVEQILDRVDIARDRNEGVTASAELYKQTTLDGWDFTSLMFDIESPLPQEVKERFVALSAHLEIWDEVEEWPAIEAIVDGVSHIAPSIAWAHSRASKGIATGCLSIPVVRIGRRSVTVNAVPLHLWFVSNEREHLAFFRDTIRSIDSSERAYEQLAPHAFPGIRFLEGVWGGLRDLSRPFQAVRSELTDLFEVLSDHGAWSFTAPGPALRKEDAMATDSEPLTNQLIERRFVTFRTDIAPEKPNVWLNSICRSDRERTVDGQVLYLEWHCKLQPHRDRVHIHHPIPPDNRIVVGIIHEHLRLP